MAAREGPFTRWGAIFGGLGLIVAIAGVVLATQSTQLGTAPGAAMPTPDLHISNSNKNDGTASPLPTGGSLTTTTPSPVRSTGSGSSTGSTSSGNPRTSSPAQTTQASLYVQTSRFSRFSQSYGEFAYDASGTRLTITSTGDYWERGGILADSTRCTITVEFDLRLEEAVYHTDAHWGFGVLARGHLQDDQPAGSVLVIDGPDDEFGSLAAFSTEPIPGHGGFGFDWHTVADPRQERHVTVSMSGSSMHAVVAGEQLDADFGYTECGSLMFFTWGGATAHLNNILIH